MRQAGMGGSWSAAAWQAWLLRKGWLGRRQCLLLGMAADCPCCWHFRWLPWPGNQGLRWCCRLPGRVDKSRLCCC